jgi:hypothetical protein
MAINSFSQGVTPSAIPLPVTTASATTSATTTDITVTWTADTKGAVPTAYTVTGTATGGFTTTATTSSTTATLTKQNGGRAYTFAVVAQNKFGNAAARNSSPVTPPFVYREAITATSTVNYTIPTGLSKMAAIVYGGGGNGSPQALGFTNSVLPGKGGGGASAVEFQEYSITQDQVYTLTVASAGGQSKITAPDTTIIAAANGGAQGGTGPGTNAGGTATSNVATNATITGGAGGGGASGFVGTSNAGQAGANGSATAFTVLTGYALPASVAVALGGGGGGGTGRRMIDQRYGDRTGNNAAGGSASSGGAAGQSGGDAGNDGQGFQGAGGGGGGFAAGSGTSGGVGRVVVYVA